MGVDLQVIANHDLDFTDKSIDEVIKEIKSRLDAIENWNELISVVYCNDKSKKQNFNWTRIDVYEHIQPEYLAISFETEHSIMLTFYRKYFIIGCIERYTDWYIQAHNNNGNNSYRNNWRKVFYALLTALGGNKVVYIPDNGIALSEFAEGIWDNLDMLLSEAKEKYGNPKQDFDEMYREIYKIYENNYENDTAPYMIDYFNDLI